MNANRILIVEVNWLGDCLFSTPFIRAVRNNFPKAYIACMAVPRVKEVLEGNPNINEIIVYDAGSEQCSPLQVLRGNINFVKQLKKYKFDTAFLLHRSFTRAFMVFMAGIPGRIGYRTFKRAFLLTKPIEPEDMPLQHRAEFYLGLARGAGLEIDAKGCDFFISRADSDWAENFLKESAVSPGEKIIVFNPGGNWLPKRWPKDYFIALGKLFMSNRSSRARIVISGAAKDLELAQDISKEAGSGVIIMCGKATIKQSAALFKKADLVISNDSGPLHIAVSVGAKVIALFGPTSPLITGPYQADPKKVIILQKSGAGCDIPCYDDSCANYRCMASIKPREVFEAALNLMTKSQIQNPNESLNNKY